MKKRVFGRKLSRDRGSRKALFISLIKALVLHGEIITTYAKAKAIKSQIERLVGMTRKEGISARRRVYASLANDRKTTDSLFGIAPQFTGRNSGFTRIIKLPERRGDISSIVRLEWSQKIKIQTKKEGKEKKEAEKPIKKGLKGKVLERAKNLRKRSMPK